MNGITNEGLISCAPQSVKGLAMIAGIGPVSARVLQLVMVLPQ